MGIFEDAGKNTGVEAAKTVAGAVDHVSDQVGNAAKDLGTELADGVSITADAINRLNETFAEESAEWRKEVSALTAQVSRFADFLDRISVLPPKA